jgi:hypothetical protein
MIRADTSFLRLCETPAAQPGLMFFGSFSCGKYSPKFFGLQVRVTSGKICGGANAAFFFI